MYLVIFGHDLKLPYLFERPEKIAIFFLKKGDKLLKLINVVWLL